MSCGSNDDYHWGELRVALDPAHPSHILPPLLPPDYKVLDVGCGAGQTLIAAYPDRVCFGIDVDEGAVRLGRSLAWDVRFTCGRAEALPFRGGHFDFVIARVSLAYTDIPRALREIRRVLRDGGKVWMVLHPFAVPWQQARRANVNGWIFFAYVMLNSALFYFAGRQFRVAGKCESFQTSGGMSRALRAAGFDKVKIDRGAHFVVTASAR